LHSVAIYSRFALKNNMEELEQALLAEYKIGDLKLKNRVVMSSLTRGRATNAGLVPTLLMAEYYAQRASAGLILTEGTWVNSNLSALSTFREYTHRNRLKVGRR
jgi:2,4-dienoyl-CoA reductase-like NADH-dependent reductase (Old Yellow Enzyme family)